MNPYHRFNQSDSEEQKMSPSMTISFQVSIFLIHVGFTINYFVCFSLLYRNNLSKKVQLRKYTTEQRNAKDRENKEQVEIAKLWTYYSSYESTCFPNMLSSLWFFIFSTTLSIVYIFLLSKYLNS